MNEENQKALEKAAISEIWLPIAGYEGIYEVSDLGRVRSLKFGKSKILIPGKTGCGYLFVILCKDSKGKCMTVHRLVASAFIPNPLNLPQVNHIDENKLNNNVTNLEWCTASYNNNYGTRIRRLAEAIAKALSKPVQQLDKATGELLATFPSTVEAERITGIARSSICKCCLRKRKSAGGFIWKYA